jgi:hypothetical protein
LECPLGVVAFDYKNHKIYITDIWNPYKTVEDNDKQIFNEFEKHPPLYPRGGHYADKWVKDENLLSAFDLLRFVTVMLMTMVMIVLFIINPYRSMIWGTVGCMLYQLYLTGFVQQCLGAVNY